MLKWKKWLAAPAAALALVTVLACNPASERAMAATFGDINRHWAEKTIEWAYGGGIVDGYGDGTFRPEQMVSEPEFLAMLIRAFPDAGKAGPVGEAGAGAKWFDEFYAVAKALSWPVQGSESAAGYNRGHVAQLVAGTQGQRLNVDAAVQYLLDHKLSQGKTAATVAGYKAEDPLSRAEAVQFLRNAKQAGLTVQASAPVPNAGHALSVRGISIGDAEADVAAKLGEPARRDRSKYGFDWLIYNNDLINYTQIGIRGGKVVGLYTSGSDWSTPQGAAASDTRSELAASLGSPLTFLQKGNTRFRLSADGETAMYLADNAYLTFYFDTHENNRISGLQVVEKTEEDRLASFYGPATEELAASYEHEIFDLANAERARRGLKPYEWNGQVAGVSRSHSADMAEQDYFAHASLQGAQPWDRAVKAGLRYSSYAENIAAGQKDAFEAHNGWLNSTTGHRENMLGKTSELGVGVAFGGSMSAYYTQNFYTPR